MDSGIPVRFCYLAEAPSLARAPLVLGRGPPAERGEDRHPLVQVHLPELPAVAAMPAKRRAPEPRRLLVAQEEDELERLAEPDVLGLGRRRERLGRVPVVEGATERV